MTSFDRDAPLRRPGALQLLGDAQTPLAERPIKVADRLAAYLLGARMDELARAARCASWRCPAHDPGPRRGGACRARAALAHEPRCRSSSPGPDAESLLAKAHGRPLVVVHVRDLEQRDVMADATLVSALEGRPLVFEGLEDLEPGRARTPAARDRAARRADRDRRAHPHRGARARRPDRAAGRGRRRRRSPSAAGLGRPHRRRRRPRDVAAKFRLSIGADRRGGRGRAAGRDRRAAPRSPDARRTSTSARARRPPRGSASSPRASRPATAGTTSSCPSASASCCSRSAPTCATATACSPTGATRRRSPAPRA